MWVSLSQRNAKLQTVKIGDLKKILPLGWSRIKRGRPRFWSHTMRSSTTLDPFDLQRLTIALLKDLNVFFWYISDQETSSTIEIDFALSKLPHFNSVYWLGVQHLFSETVYATCCVKRCQDYTPREKHFSDLWKNIFLFCCMYINKVRVFFLKSCTGLLSFHLDKTGCFTCQAWYNGACLLSPQKDNVWFQKLFLP